MAQFRHQSCTRMRMLLGAVAMLVSVATPAAHAQAYELCERSGPSGAVVEDHLDCGGARARGKTFDYVTVSVFDPDGRDAFVWQVEVPDQSSVVFSRTAYAWASWVGEYPG